MRGLAYSTYGGRSRYVYELPSRGFRRLATRLRALIGGPEGVRYERAKLFDQIAARVCRDRFCKPPLSALTDSLSHTHTHTHTIPEPIYHHGTFKLTPTAVPAIRINVIRTEQWDLAAGKKEWKIHPVSSRCDSFFPLHISVVYVCVCVCFSFFL